MNKQYSFIIPHKNSPDLLNRCIQSIPKRDDIEIIIVDDNSDKNTSPQIDEKDERIKIIKISNSKGAGHARNVGLSKATGKWILFADCDDYYEKGFITILDKYILSNYDIIYFDAYFNYNINKHQYNHNKYPQIIETYLSCPTYYNAINLKHAFNAPWNKMYSRTFLHKINAFFEEIPIGNDAWFIQYTGSKTNNIYAINKKLYYYTVNDKGITQSKHSKEAIFLLIKSEIKINNLKARNKAWNYIPRPYYNIKKYSKEYDFSFKLKLYIYKILHEYPYILVFINKQISKFIHKS